MLTSTERNRRILGTIVSVKLVEADRAGLRLWRINDAHKTRDLLATRVDADNAAFDNHIHTHATRQTTMAGEENVIVLAAQGTIQKIRHRAVAGLSPHAAVAEIGGYGVDAWSSRIYAARLEIEHRSAAVSVLAERLLRRLMAAVVAKNEAFLVARRRFALLVVIVMMVREDVEIVEDLSCEICR